MEGTSTLTGTDRVRNFPSGCDRTHCLHCTACFVDKVSSRDMGASAQLRTMKTFCINGLSTDQYSINTLFGGKRFLLDTRRASPIWSGYHGPGVTNIPTRDGLGEAGLWVVLHKRLRSRFSLASAEKLSDSRQASVGRQSFLGTSVKSKHAVLMSPP